MKTDDYKQELRLSATLDARNTKKIFLRSKNISKSPEKFWDFFQSCRGRSQDSLVRQIAPKKRAPLEEPLESDDDITLVSVFLNA